MDGRTFSSIIGPSFVAQLKPYITESLTECKLLSPLVKSTNTLLLCPSGPNAQIFRASVVFHWYLSAR